MERMSLVDAYHSSISSNTSTDAGGNGNGNANENGSGNENAPIYVQRDERNASIEVWKYEIMEVQKSIVPYCTALYCTVRRVCKNEDGVDGE